VNKLISTTIAAMLAVAAVSAEAKDWTSIRIAIEGAYPPFSEITPAGEMVGFDVDIARALCAEVKAECTLVQQDWDGMIPGLLARKFDAIVASMSITAERKKKISFTGKYTQTPARFIRKMGSGIEVENGGLDGAVVGVQRATTHDSFLTANFGNKIEIKRYTTLNDAYLDMTAGRIDVLLADSIALNDGFLSTDAGKDYEFVGGSYSDRRWFGDGAGVAVRKEDNDLRELLDGAISSIRQNGAYKRVQDKYFDFDIYGG
jgi:arginine/ornithine transport system substrate-binding protein